jgi:hypothetical protein
LEERAPPFLATDIDLRKLGIAHCTIPSFVVIRCSYFGVDRAFTVTLRKQKGESGSNWSELWKAGAIIVLGVVAHWVLGEYLTKEQVKLDHEMKEKRRKAEEEAKRKEAEGEAPKEREADESGKFKTD